MATPGYTRLQEVITVSTNKGQDIHDAADCGRFEKVVVQVRRLGNAPVGGKIQMQHAAVNTDDAYENIGATVDFTGTTWPKSIVIVDHSRHLRWSTIDMNGSATFSIDIVGR